MRTYFVGWNLTTVKELAHVAPAHLEVLSSLIRCQLLITVQEVDSFTTSHMIDNVADERLNLWGQISSGDILKLLHICTSQVLTR